MSDGIEREYRGRRVASVVVVALVAMGLLVVLNASSAMALDGQTASDWSDWLVLALWVFIGVRVVLEQWWARTSVTADGVTARGPFRTRTFAWSEVYGIRVEGSKRGSPRWPAYLYATDGRRARLPHLDEQQLDDPVAEVADLCATAVRLGLTSLETRAEVEERIQRGARRRKAWQRAGFASLVLALAAFVFETWAIFTDRPTHMYLLVLGVPLLCLPVFFLLLDRLGETLAGRRSPSQA